MVHGGESTGVAYVPGFMQRGEAWTPVAARVARRHRPVLVDFDTPTLEGTIDAIVAAGTGGAVAAYSMGGRIALHAAVKHRAAFRALILVGATPGIEHDAHRRSRRAADEDLAAWMAGERIDAVVNYWESRPVFASQDERLIAAQRAGRMSHDPAHLSRMLRATGQGALDPIWHRLRDISIPVLAIAGEYDTKYARVAERMAAELPRGRVAIVEDAGHAAHLEQPEAVAELALEFLDENLG